MRVKEKPGGQTPGNGTGRNAAGRLLSYPDYSKLDPVCQVCPALDLAGLWLANAESLLSDPDPAALRWALDLLSRAHRALDLPQEVIHHDTN